ncbi:maltase A3-like isoform X1 [Periplaneta americana]|uniref:maltase A3-like isoform X1 n=1 Tax=Periplaneta americana TaxID=6978 RepID=UPI0037E98CF8
MFRVAVAVALMGAVLAEQDPLDWWKTTVVYQVYPRSFKDSNGDGNGDLNGITEKLDHLKDLGVGAVWLSPIYKSPMVDNGYDISDFYDVDPSFGTLDDFAKLKARAKELDIMVVLDFVPNHSSDEHEWFEKSVQKIEPYTDYYVWHDGKIDPDTGIRVEPSNWISIFSGSMWTWNDQRQQYYLHQFGVKQPDLNFRNPAVMEEMKNVLRFWVDRGVDGFRVDAVPHIVEDAAFTDEERTNYPGVPPTDYNYLYHVHTANRPETYDVIKEWRSFLDGEFKDKDNHTRVIMTEVYASIEETMAYYGNDTNPGAYFTFNFNLVNSAGSWSTANDFNNVIHSWVDNIPEGKQSNWVAGNHDNSRVANRYGTNMVDAVNMLVTLLPGTAVTYYGEELGMEDLAMDSPSDNRDPERTPFQWDNTTSAGFSTSNVTWLPVNPNYKDLNLVNEKAAEKSHYHVYKQLLQARQEPAIQQGSLHTNVIGDVFSFSRELEGATIFVVVMNLSDSEQTVDLEAPYPSLPQSPLVHTASINSNLTQGQRVSRNLTLGPREAVVLTS